MRLRLHHFQHGDFRAELIGPESPDELIDVSQFNVDERLPYWAELWPSARALAAELLDRDPPHGRTVELGCGLALPSLVLRWRGVEVVASDYYPEALDFAVANALRNDISPPEPLLLDWRSPPPDLLPFEFVVAADVLYERRNAEALVDLFPRVVAPGGTVLLADPGRTYLPHFQELLTDRGWRVEEARTRPAAGPSEEKPLEIRLLTISRRGEAV